MVCQFRQGSGLWPAKEQRHPIGAGIYLASVEHPGKYDPGKSGAHQGGT